MVRPKKKRFVSAPPSIEEFVPGGAVAAGEVLLTVEEFEAMRLSDYEGLAQENGAAAMGISRHTFGRLLFTARRKIAEALVEGKRLKVGGGHYELCGRGRQHRHRRRGGGGCR